MATIALSAPVTQRAVVTRSTDIMRILPLILLVYCIVATAPEARVPIGGFMLYSYRIVIIPSLAVVLYRLFLKQWRLAFPDFLVLILGLWPMLSFSQVYDVDYGLKSGGAAFLDAAGAWFVARACIQSPTDLRRVLIFCIPGFLFAAGIMVIESLSHRLIYRPASIAIFGGLRDPFGSNPSGFVELEAEMRYGLLRAFGTFSHPIIGGMVMISALPLYYASKITPMPRTIGMIAAFAGLFSISSAAIMSLIVSIGLYVIDGLKAKFEGLSWRLIVWLVMAAMVAGHFLSKGGIFNIISRITINPATAYTRQLIYQYGWQSIIKHPWFGIGLEGYDRPSGLTPSVDAHFLAQGISTGVVPLVCSLSVVIYIMFALGNRIAKMQDKLAKETLFGVNLCVFALFLGGITVTYFGEGKIWLMAVLGLSMSLVHWSDKAIRATAARGA